MGFHDVLVLLAVILTVLMLVGGFVLWFVLRNIRFSELRRDVDYVKDLIANHVSKQEEQENNIRKEVERIEKGVRDVKLYHQQMSDQVRQKLGIERRTAMIQRREFERAKAPNPPSPPEE